MENNKLTYKEYCRLNDQLTVLFEELNVNIFRCAKSVDYFKKGALYYKKKVLGNIISQILL